MTIRSCVAAAFLLVLAACAPVTEYTESEAVNRLTLDDASRHFTLHFIAGSDRLAAGDLRRLRQMAADGTITARDRVTVSPGGDPRLANRRAAALSSELLRHGIIPSMRPLASVPRDQAIIDVGRYLVTFPPCPNWSKPPASDFGNTLMSNHGCATVSGLGQMVANPADLVTGRPVGPAEGGPAVAAMKRYLTDKVELPKASAASPIAAPTTAAPGAGGGTPAAGS